MPDMCERPSEMPEERHEKQSYDIAHSRDSSTVNVLYRAPSWSWASVDNQVTYPYTNNNIGSGNNHSLIEYVDHHMDLSTDADLYGEVKNGYLTVKAQTIMVTLTEVLHFGQPRPASQTTQVSINGYIVDTQGNVSRDDLDGMFELDPHCVFLRCRFSFPSLFRVGSS